MIFSVVPKFFRIGNAMSARKLSQFVNNKAIIPYDSSDVFVWKAGLLEYPFAASFLRRSCTSYIDPTTGQKLNQEPTTQQSNSIIDTKYQDGVWDIEYADGHLSQFSDSFFQNLVESSSSNHFESLDCVQPHHHSFKGILKQDIGLCQWLHELAWNGFAIVETEDNHSQDDAVINLADRICYPQRTMYGVTFDVISEPDPINIAYTTAGLALHQDLIYLESPPGLQFLHCLEFDENIPGGFSTLMDGFKLAEKFRVKHPFEFEILCKIPTTFQKVHYRREIPVHIVARKPIIQVDDSNEISGIHWAPPFEGQMPYMSLRDQNDYFHAYDVFEKLIRDSSELLVKFRLKPGQILTFNNRRMLHGREKFELQGQGTRHLKGTYVNIDDFKSRYHYLRQKFNFNSPRHFGDGR